MLTGAETSAGSMQEPRGDPGDLPKKPRPVLNMK